MEEISCTDRVKQSVSISVGIFHKSCRCVRQFPDGFAACGCDDSPWPGMIRRHRPVFPVSCRCSPLGNCYNRGREALPAPFGKERFLCGKIVCSVWDWCFACCAELSAPEEQSPCSQTLPHGRPVRAKRKRHPCGCLLSEIFFCGFTGKGCASRFRRERLSGCFTPVPDRAPPDPGWHAGHPDGCAPCHGRRVRPGR